MRLRRREGPGDTPAASPSMSHQQELVALTQSGPLNQRAWLDRVNEAHACVAAQKGELGDEAIAIQSCVLDQGTGAPHVTPRRDRWPEGPELGNKIGSQTQKRRETMLAGWGRMLVARLYVALKLGDLWVLRD